MISSVSFVSHEAAENMVPEPCWAIISITGFNPYANRNEAELHPAWAEVLRLEFDDVAIRDDYFQAISMDQGRQIIDFLNSVQDSVDQIYVHCLAGVSRSAGVAKFIAERYGLEFDQAYDLYNPLVYQTLIDVDGGKNG